MKILITESQYRVILSETHRRKINIDLENIKKFAEETVGKIQDDIGIQFKMLFTWGAAVGGVIGPLNGFIQTGNFDLSPYETALILVATAAMVFNENTRTIKKLISKIKELGLEDTFKEVLSKGTLLKQAFLDFIESLNVSLYTMTNIMSYAFLIPILPTLWEFSQSGVEVKDIKDIATRLLAFGLTSVTGVTLKKLVSAILKRFR